MAASHLTLVVDDAAWPVNARWVRGTISGHQYIYELAGTGGNNYVPRQAGLKRGKQGEWYLARKFGDLTSNLPERQVRGGRGDLTKDFQNRAEEMKMLRAGRR